MKEFTKEELVEIEGGGLRLYLAVVGGAIAMAIGIIDGYLRPSKC